jgi:hypothetical protein
MVGFLLRTERGSQLLATVLVCQAPALERYGKGNVEGVREVRMRADRVWPDGQVTSRAHASCQRRSFFLVVRQLSALLGAAPIPEIATDYDAGQSDAELRTGCGMSDPAAARTADVAQAPAAAQTSSASRAFAAAVVTFLTAASSAAAGSTASSAAVLIAAGVPHPLVGGTVIATFALPGQRWTRHQERQGAGEQQRFVIYHFGTPRSDHRK